ncbi:MAG TPA: hypothetical protein PL045_02730, partial [Chitinophagaceae bacterium]|nr:hypothetical protein [Chitinophagaceae bacterium]
IGNFDGMSFHISTRRNEVLTFDSAVRTNTFYIADCDQLQNKQYTSYLSFTNYLADPLELVTFNNEDTIRARK